MWQASIEVKTSGKGLYLVTEEVLATLPVLPEVGLLHLFISHTSASLILQENADPSARRDLERFFDRLIPDGQDWHEHTHEGLDDTTSHMKSALTNVSLTIPISSGRVALGTWQGIYLWEHRVASHRRTIVLTVSP